MRSNVIEAITGAVVLLVAALFFYFAYSSSGAKHLNGYHLFAQFDRIDGLIEGNDVKLSGVKVGVVEKINVDEKTYLANVEIAMDNKIKLPVDSTAQIVSESFMGGKYIALVPGGEDDMLKSGDTIIHTQSAISFESLIGKFLFSKNDEASNKESSEQKTTSK